MILMEFCIILFIMNKQMFHLGGYDTSSFREFAGFFLNDQVARWWFEAFLFCFPDPSKDDPIWLIIIILAAKDGYVAPPVPAVVQAESVKISAVDTTAAWFQKRSSILVGTFFK